jgi:hypothetical protein
MPFVPSGVFRTMPILFLLWAAHSCMAQMPGQHLPGLEPTAGYSADFLRIMPR